MNSKNFGNNLTINNFFNSNEYNKILNVFKPNVILSGKDDKLSLTLEYPNRNINFSFPADCKYSHTDSRQVNVNFIESMFSSATGTIEFYKIENCTPYKNDLEQISKFEEKILGKSTIHSTQWEVSKYSHSENIYQKNNSTASNTGGSRNYITVNIDCIAAICTPEKFHLSGGPGKVMDPGRSSSTSIHDTGQGISGRYNYSVKLTPVNRICSGSFNISGTKQNVTIGVFENCSARVDEF